METELPPCFAAHCDPEYGGCGWKGRVAQAHVYVSGANYPITDFEARPTAEEQIRCPKCRRRVVRRCDRESMAARLRWHVDHFARKDHGRGGEFFPCTCAHTPPCRLDGEAEIREAICGDVFSDDAAWVRVSAKVRCCGCHAPGKLAAVERHGYRGLDVHVGGGVYRHAWEV